MNNETKIFNGTPHAINIVEGATFNPQNRKFCGGNVVRVIPSNGMLNAKMSTIELPSVDGIPTFGKSFDGVDALPDGFDIYIVSALFSSAMQKVGADMSKIFTIADPVMSEDGNTFVGCRGICPAF
jgi:hypothetical protein